MNQKKYLIRKAELNEIYLLSKIAYNSKGYWGYDQDFMEKCRLFLTISENDIETTPIYIIEDKSVILGFYQLKPLNKEEIDLAMFFIKPEFIKKNLGTILLDHCKTISKNLGFKTLIIESDPNAKGFYEKQGGLFKGYANSEVLESRMLPVFRLELI